MCGAAQFCRRVGCSLLVSRKPESLKCSPLSSAAGFRGAPGASRSGMRMSRSRPSGGDGADAPTSPVKSAANQDGEQHVQASAAADRRLAVERGRDPPGHGIARKAKAVSVVAGQRDAQGADEQQDPRAGVSLSGPRYPHRGGRRPLAIAGVTRGVVRSPSSRAAGGRTPS